MPRSDGLPTNREMVVDFSTLSRTAYIDAYNRVAEGGLPDAFQGKPLSEMYLSVQRAVPPSLRTETGVVAERLRVDPLRTDHVDFMTETLTFQDNPEDVVKHYYDVARQIGDVTLHSGLDIVPIVPPEGVHADYEAEYPSGSKRYVTTFKARPSRLIIVAAEHFVEQAIEEINIPLESTDLDPTDFESVVRRIAEQGGPSDHSLAFNTVPNLPLSGYESEEFLNTYANDMLNRARNARESLKKAQQLHHSPSTIENAQLRYDDAINSYKRAQELLDRK